MAARMLGGGDTHSRRRMAMPFVNIQITHEETTPEQKAALIQGATQLLADVLKSPRRLPSWSFRRLTCRIGALAGYRWASIGVRQPPNRTEKRSFKSVNDGVAV